MSAQIPQEWFRSIVLEATAWNARERHIDRLWHELSKPKNAAKIPEVAELIKEAQSMVDKVNNDYSTSWLEDALAPFKGSE